MEEVNAVSFLITQPAEGPSSLTSQMDKTQAMSSNGSVPEKVDSSEGESLTGRAPDAGADSRRNSSVRSTVDKTEAMMETHRETTTGADVSAVPESIRPSMALNLVTDEKKAKIYDMHNIIQTTIGQIQDKTQQILQDQERDLIRAFRLRLAQVQEDLEKERKKNESGSAEWVVRCHKLTEELEWLRELTDKLTTENSLFIQENKRFARQLAAQDQDRSFMLRQLVAAKKENARLRLALEGQGAEEALDKHGRILAQLPHPQLLDKPLSASLAKPGATANALLPSGGLSRTGTARGTPPSPSALLPRTGTARATATSTLAGALNSARNGTPSQPGSARGANADAGEEDASALAALRAQMSRLQRERDALDAQLTRTRKSQERAEERCRKLETQLSQQRAERGELMSFFRQAVDDVRADIAARRVERARAVGGRGVLRDGCLMGSNEPLMIDPRTIPPSEFTVRDRVHVLEWMLTQDHVVRHIFDGIFPNSSATASAALGSGSSQRNLAPRQIPARAATTHARPQRTNILEKLLPASILDVQRSTPAAQGSKPAQTQLQESATQELSGTRVSPMAGSSHLLRPLVGQSEQIHPVQRSRTSVLRGARPGSARVAAGARAADVEDEMEYGSEAMRVESQRGYGGQIQGNNSSRDWDGEAEALRMQMEADLNAF